MRSARAGVRTGAGRCAGGGAAHAKVHWAWALRAEAAEAPRRAPRGAGARAKAARRARARRRRAGASALRAAGAHLASSATQGRVRCSRGSAPAPPTCALGFHRHRAMRALSRAAAACGGAAWSACDARVPPPARTARRAVSRGRGPCAPRQRRAASGMPMPSAALAPHGGSMEAPAAAALAPRCCAAALRQQARRRRGTYVARERALEGRRGALGASGWTPRAGGRVSSPFLRRAPSPAERLRCAPTPRARTSAALPRASTKARRETASLRHTSVVRCAVARAPLRWLAASRVRLAYCSELVVAALVAAVAPADA